MFDSNTLIASLIWGSIGAGFAVYGKKQQRFPQMLIGVGMMVFPYFVPTVPWMLGVSAALVVALVLMVRFGL